MTCQLPADGLDALFRCPAIGRDLALRHCLRRQDEQREVRGAKGEVICKEPVRTECVGCSVGADNRAMAALARPAAARAVEPTVPNERLWDGRAPDVPLGPPPGASHERPAPNWTLTGPVAPTTARRRSWDHEQEQHQEPATPAEETMGKPCKKCGKELVDWNKSGLCGNRGECGRRAAAAGGAPKPAKEPAKRTMAEPKKIAGPRPPNFIATARATLGAMSVQDLIALKNDVQQELTGRRERMQAELQELQAAVG